MSKRPFSEHPCALTDVLTLESQYGEMLMKPTAGISMSQLINTQNPQ